MVPISILVDKKTPILPTLQSCAKFTYGKTNWKTAVLLRLCCLWGILCQGHMLYSIPSFWRYVRGRTMTLDRPLMETLPPPRAVRARLGDARREVELLRRLLLLTERAEMYRACHLPARRNNKSNTDCGNYPPSVFSPFTSPVMRRPGRQTQTAADRPQTKGGGRDGPENNVNMPFMGAVVLRA